MIFKFCNRTQKEKSNKNFSEAETQNIKFFMVKLALHLKLWQSFSTNQNKFSDTEKAFLYFVLFRLQEATGYVVVIHKIT